jgi:hypothetical protein
MAAPPLLKGAVKVIVAEALAAVAATPVGAPGLVTGITELLTGVETALVKGVTLLLVAVTVKV